MIRKIHFLISRSLLLCLCLAGINKQGLAQTYTMPASGSASYTTCSGTFYDQGGSAGNYSNNTNSTIVFTPNAAGNKARLNFSSFDLENNADFLYIYNGASTAAPLIGVFTGSGSPGLVVSSATDGTLTVRFVSDASNTATGWVAALSCIGSATPCQTINASLTSSVPANVSNIIKVCPGTTVSFTGSATFSGTNGGLNANYIWKFGDGVSGTGTSVSHTYASAGTYPVDLVVLDTAGCRSQNSIDIVVQAAGSTKFTGSSAAMDTIVCLDDQTTLTGAAQGVQVTYQCAPPVAGVTFLPDGNGVSYETAINVSCYQLGQTITAANQILSVCMNMEHSYLGDLDMVIRCPNGQSATLKQFPGGGGTYLGEPNDNGANDMIPGNGYDYCFSPTATWGTMVSRNNAAGWVTNVGDPPGNSMMPGTYTPYQAFTALVGCPLNGDWTLKITDHQTSDNGYIFSWGVNFSTSLFPANYTFTPTISSQAWQSDATILSTAGNNATVKPGVAGQKCYTYRATDNFGCIRDTSVCVYVRPDASASVGLTTATANSIQFALGCDEGSGWTYYRDPTNNKRLGFAVNWGTGNNAAKAAAKVYVTLNGANTASYAGLNGIWAMRRFWNVDLGATALVNPVRVRFYYDPADTVAMHTSLRAVMGTAADTGRIKWFKTTGALYAPSQVTNTNINNGNKIILTPAYGIENGIRYVEFTNITSFSGGTGALGAGAGATALPVTLMNFSAAKEKGGSSVAAAWEVAHEDIAYYEVQRSLDAVHFETIATVKAEGKSRYAYTDMLPIQFANKVNNLYYRLNMAEPDGSGTYSNTLRVAFDNFTRGEVRLSPNPAKHMLSVDNGAASLNGENTMISDVTGRVVYQFQMEDHVDLDISAWPAGVYLVKLSNGEVIRFVKE